MHNGQMRRELGLIAVTAIVAGDILGSGIFFTPGELAAAATSNWQVYFIWALCGVIVLCGALTLAESAVLLPRAGATYHMIREAWGPFWGFLKIWMELCVAGPGSVAGVAILFGGALAAFLGGGSPVWIASVGIILFVAVNLLGVRWGGRTQVTLTAIKIAALFFLIAGSLKAAPAVQTEAVQNVDSSQGIWPFLRFIGVGVAAVLFTYDGWIDVTHVSGEVRNPSRNLPLGLACGVGLIVLLYLLVNLAYLRHVPLEEMRKAPAEVAGLAAKRAFGETGGRWLEGMIIISIFGALGGIIMTLPRLFYAGASDLSARSHGHVLQPVFGILSAVTRKSAVPAGAILFCGITSIAAVIFFQSFSRIVNFFVVAAQTANILAVSSIFRLQRTASYKTPGYPAVPLIFIGTMILLLISVVIYQPFDSLIGIGLTLTGLPVYLWLTKTGPGLKSRE